jgi:cell pole-organizing protein PopZ
MSDSRSGNNDPSMDDILASIRKIISDDEARAQVGGQSIGGASATPPPAANQGGEPGTVTPIPVAPEIRLGNMARRDDVLLLTDLVEEPKTPPPPPRAVQEPVVTPVTAGAPAPSPPEPTSAFTPAPPPRIEPESAVMPPSNEPTSPVDQTLVGATVAGAASSAFDRLSQAVQDSVPAPSAHDPGPTMSGGKTLEDVVKEMLKPMLKDWLDRNLPPMVERFVEREIVRLTRR